MFLSSSFFEGLFVLIFFVDRKILSLILYTGGSLQWQFAAITYLACNFVIFSCIKSHTSSMRFTIDLAVLLAIFSLVELTDRSTGSKLILGLQLLVARNDGTLVVAETFALAENSPIDRSQTQSS